MKSLAQFFRDLSLGHKLLGGYTLLFAAAVLLGCTIIYYQVKAAVESQIESELTNATSAIVNMVRTATATSIKNHLRAVAEKNLDIVNSIYKEFETGALTEEQARTMCRKVLFSQVIGKTGYIFCANSNAIAIEHPNPGINGKTYSERTFVQDMIRMKTGYLEYQWQNPEDDGLKPKAMYMAYFKPWDWIIAVSSYRDEFLELINISDFKKSISSLKFGESGYAYISDTKGNLIVHPFMTGNFLDSTDSSGNYFAREICEKKSGKAVYTWKNPGETQAREKLVIFSYLPEYDWIVGSASYLDEVYAPLKTLRRVILTIVLFTCALVFTASLKINRLVVHPLETLIDRFDRGPSGDFYTPVPVLSNDEIGRLSKYFNRFTDKLNDYKENLLSEVREHEQTTKALRLSEEMFSKAFRSNPSGMFICSLKTGRIINVNDSFLTFTQRSMLDTMGREIMQIRLFNSGGEGRALLQDTETKGRVPPREIYFLTADGEKKKGIISTERAMVWGEPCMLAAMEDITESSRLEREILTVSERERRKIAMDLHDDLCPQLMGIEVMTKMLAQKIDQKNLGGNLDPEIEKTSKIRALIQDAVEKTRALSRGISPVNLADRGLDVSLEDLAAYVNTVFHISCTLAWTLDRPFKDPELAAHVYYIAHEAVYNAVKHARASRIRICLEGLKETAMLTVTDNGTGFTPNGTALGMGLKIMSYRAAQIGGSLEIKSLDQGGTGIFLAFAHRP